MLISTRGRYALRVMLELSNEENGNFMSLKTVSVKQQISLKYLEIIVALLNKGQLVDSHRGKNGGYKLKKMPKDYTIGEILRTTEEGLLPVDCSCLKETDVFCERAKNCLTQPLWKGLDQSVNSYLDSITLLDVKQGNLII